MVSGRLFHRVAAVFLKSLLLYVTHVFGTLKSDSDSDTLLADTQQVPSSTKGWSHDVPYTHTPGSCTVTHMITFYQYQILLG